LSSLFLLGYIPFMTVQNLITNIQAANDFGNLGFQLLAVLYLAQMIFSAIGASIASSLGLKGAFVTGFFLLSVMVFSQILTVWRAQQI
jgi:hypothetical protein